MSRYLIEMTIIVDGESEEDALSDALYKIERYVEVESLVSLGEIKED